MKKNWERFAKVFTKFCLVAIVFAVILTVNSTQAQAASTRTKALNAYNKLLSQKSLKWSGKTKVSTNKCKFAVIYVDNDSVPELFVDAGGAGTNHVSGFYKLYTFWNGKVRDVCTMRDGFGYYKKKGIFQTYTMLHGEYTTYQKLASGKSSVKLSSESYFTTNYYDSNNKKISKAMFNKSLKSLVGTAKVSVPVCKINTKANRTKYLK